MKLSPWMMALFFMMTTAAHASVNHSDWGKTPGGEAVDLYTLRDADLTVRITTFGARIVSIEAPDRRGQREDVVLGHDTLEGYEQDRSTYFGAIVGRYGNRIAKGRFTIDGHAFQVPVNNGPNALHGGTTGFDRKVWKARELPDGVEMTLLSPDGDMGFPGALTAHVTYTLVGKSLHIEYEATTTKPTMVNLTNHSYFNLAGNGRGTILGTLLMIDAQRYTPVDAGLIPVGEPASVEGTPFDFRKATAIGARIHETNEQLKIAGGYDHNFILDGGLSPTLHLAARAVDPESGRTLTVMTTQPGVQFYSGNFLDGTMKGKHGVLYPKNSAFCLETQHFPDSPNHPSYPSTLLRPGQVMRSSTVFIFGVER